MSSFERRQSSLLARQMCPNHQKMQAVDETNRFLPKTAWRYLRARSSSRTRMIADNRSKPSTWLRRCQLQGSSKRRNLSIDLLHSLAPSTTRVRIATTSKRTSWTKHRKTWQMGWVATYSSLPWTKRQSVMLNRCRTCLMMPPDCRRLLS